MSIHRGHMELLADTSENALVSYENARGLWHARIEVVDFDPERGDGTVTVYAQGGPADEAPDAIEEIANEIPIEQARMAALGYAAEYGHDPS